MCLIVASSLFNYTNIYICFFNSARKLQQLYFIIVQIYLPPDLFDFSGTLKLSGGAIKEAIKTRYISKKIGVDTLKEYHLLLAGMLMTSITKAAISLQ